MGSSTYQNELSNNKLKKQSLSVNEYLTGWSILLYGIFFDRNISRHLKSPLPLPPLSHLTIIITCPPVVQALKVEETWPSHELIWSWQHETQKQLMLCLFNLLLTLQESRVQGYTIECVGNLFLSDSVEATRKSLSRQRFPSFYNELMLSVNL